MPKVSLRTNQRGSLLVEAMLAGAVFGLLVMSLVGVLTYATLSVRLAGNRARAAFLAEEGLEATRNIRDAAYTNLTNGTFGLSTVGNQWALSGSSDTTDIFTRTVTIADSTANVKQVTSTVTWQQNPQRTGSVSAVTYLTNWLIAKASAVGNWSLPQLLVGFDVSSTDDGIKIQIAGNYAYIIRSASNIDFSVVNVQNPAAPAESAFLALSGSPNNLVVSGNYAYVTSSDNSQELQVINISNPNTPTLAASLDLTGSADATGIAIVGSTLYLGRAQSAVGEFYVINIATPTSPTLLGSVGLAGDVRELSVSGSYAYAVGTDDNSELQVVNVSVTASPLLVNSLNLAGSDDANTIALAGSTVAVGRNAGNLSIINIATPLAPGELAAIGLGGTVNDVVFGNSGKYIFAGTDNSSNEFRVVDVTVPAAPTILGGLDAAGNILGVAYDEASDRAYGVSASNTSELMVFRPS